MPLTGFITPQALPHTLCARHKLCQRRRPIQASSQPTVLVPDSLSAAGGPPGWYAWLHKQRRSPVLLASLPDPYASNTKRWERVWLSALRDAVPVEAAVVAHGTGADAVLRLLEETALEGPVVLVLPSGDEYFAGERHGRAYHWQVIRGNVRRGIGIVTSTIAAAMEENERLANMLSASAIAIDASRGRLASEEHVEEVLTLLTELDNV